MSASPRRLVIASYTKLPDWEVDDKPFHDALDLLEISYDIKPWDADIDWSAYTACLIRTTWDYDERRDEFVAWAERTGKVTKLLNPAHIIRWNTDKHYLQELAQRGIPIAPTIFFEAGNQHNLAAILADHDWERGFLKPIVGASARATLRFRTDTAEAVRAAQEHLDQALASEGMMLQPYLPSVETLGERSAIVISGEITHCVRKIPVPGDYRVQDDHGASDEPDAMGHELTELTLACMAAIGEPLVYGRVDFLLDLEDKLVINELELVEPSLFFRHGPNAATALADAVQRCLLGVS